MKRGASLNLPYDFFKSNLIHLFPKFSYLAPKNNDDLKYLSKAIINKNKIIKPSHTIRHLGIQIDYRLQITPYADLRFATRKRKLSLIRSF